MIKNTIVLVPFPFDDFSVTKVRPAYLTNEIGKYNHVTIAFISSKIPDDLIESDIIIKKQSVALNPGTWLYSMHLPPLFVFNDQFSEDTYFAVFEQNTLLHTKKQPF